MAKLEINQVYSGIGMNSNFGVAFFKIRDFGVAWAQFSLKTLDVINIIFSACS